jgi:NADPH-dependent 2,4-dienoyl-CoA reductase/sulfur reductase-like enzyme
VVVGGAPSVFEAALDYHSRGRDVTVVEMMDAAQARTHLRVSAGNSAAELAHILSGKNIPVIYGLALSESGTTASSVRTWRPAR